jgi:hypothetical protein
MIVADFLSLQALLPSGAAFLASIMAIHSLLQPGMTTGRKTLCWIYALATLLITGGLVFYGAIQHEESREQAVSAKDIGDKIDRVRALLGNNPNLTGPQVLQGIIDRFSKPYEISGAQMAKLADELFYIKSELPKTVRITMAPNDNSANLLHYNLQNTFFRAGIASNASQQVPSSPSEVGVMFSVADKTNPPPIVLRLQRIFDLVNITTTLVNADNAYLGEGGFNIFVGPRPL